MSCYCEKNLSGLTGFSLTNDAWTARSRHRSVIQSIIMTAFQRLLIDDLPAQVRAYISALHLPAIVLLNICVEGTGEQQSFRVSARHDGTVVSLPIDDASSSSSSVSRAAPSTASTEETTSSSALPSSSFPLWTHEYAAPQ